MAPRSLPFEAVWASFKTEPATAIFLLGFAVVFGFLFVYPSHKHIENNKVYDLGGYPLLSAWLFFAKRYDFMRGTFKRTGQNMFRFRVLQHHVVAISGEEGRKVFFSEKSFNPEEGYKILGGPAPRPRDINISSVEESNGPFIRHVLNLFRKDRMMDIIPHLMEDINRRMDDWGKNGEMNPFKEMHALVFQMTVRMGTCPELANNEQATNRLSELFLLHEQAASPISLMLPWLPGFSSKKAAATKALFDFLSPYVDLRRRSSVQSSDSIDMLIADGYDDPTVIAYTLGIIFAGVINTGMSVCWTIVHLADNPEWKEKVTLEVKSLLLNHGSSSDLIHRRFSIVPLNVWEEQMPVLDAVIKEIIRLTVSGAALRRNIGGDILIAQKTIRGGDFLAYSLGDTHFDDQIYSEPLSFNPARFLQGREDKNGVSFPFLGWGAGRHPCAGMRAAKLEIKVAIALFLSKFEYELVDASGKYPKSLPQPDRNDIQNAKPLGEECYLKFGRVENVG
ncbi:cytochrome P450 [Mycena maculata]|uniref:Cytochrome P450 n=1 Tax=Mycena maculata TaxID=230809 RepID=A0AAD7N135_9AGAR|nr:cytochrome P450 [Mycena maculata]